MQLPANFESKINKTEGCWIWTASTDTKGYGCFFFQGRRQGAHRVMWQLVHGPIPAGMMICHHCDNPPCVRHDHLFLGTNGDNMRDCARKGRHDNYNDGKKCAKIDRDTAQKIRDLYATGQFTQQQVADRFGLHQTSVHYIVSGAYWLPRPAVN